MKIDFSNRQHFDDNVRRQQLNRICAQTEAVILSRQDPISGLLPASTGITVHGDYTDAWVRDNVYSILAVWGLALAYRRQDGERGKAYRLEQSVVKLMRGLLTAMMKQAGKVERFKHTLDPLDALHAKYDTRTADPVVGDGDWGHLQLDATSLFLLMLAQMTASGLRIVFTMDEVDFIQNLVHYLGRAYHVPDYGIWERGHKMNEGKAEINASSVGMVKAALEAMRGFDLFGGQGGSVSTIHVPADDIAQARSTLESLLPRESDSKETDAALLSVIGFPAFAIEDAELVARTRAVIVDKLRGRYGCKRFLRDGHQTVLEDHDRLHYETGELGGFEHVESEWPLFFTYLLLEGILRGDSVQAEDYRGRLEALMVERDGQRLLPELYYVPADRIEAEKARPHSQERLPNDNVPLVWAQSLYLLGVLLQEGFIEGADIDPLGRRRRVGRRQGVCIQMALLAENIHVQTRLEAHGILTQTPEQILPVQIRPAANLAAAFGELGRNAGLGLSGRPSRQLGSLETSQVFTMGPQTVLFLPPFLDRHDFYLNLDNHLLVQRLKSELAYVHRHWNQPDQPLMALLITDAMLQAGGHRVLLGLIKELQAGCCNNGVKVRVDTLTELLRVASRAHVDRLQGIDLDRRASTPHPKPVLVRNWRQVRPLSAGKAADWRQESDQNRLLEALAESCNPYEQIELLGLLWERVGPDFEISLNGSVRELTQAVYARASKTRLWGVVRRAAGLLRKFDTGLEDAVADIVVRQHQLSVGRAYSSEAVIGRPLGNEEIMERIHDYSGDDPREWVLLQEIVLYLGMLVRTEPDLFKGTLTLRAWNLLILITGALARESGVTQGEAFDALLELSPHAILNRLRQVLISDRQTRHELIHLESLHQEGGDHGLVQVHFPVVEDSAHDRQHEGGWYGWREVNGVLTRLPDDFYARVWEVLGHCRGLVIGDRLDARNRLDSQSVRADTTPGEKDFALRVEHLLNNIQAPEYRQLSIETLLALSVILRINPQLKLADDIVLDVLVGHAVYLNWRESHPEFSEGEYNEHGAEAWHAFYNSPPHRVANAIMGALSFLLETAEREMPAAA